MSKSKPTFADNLKQRAEARNEQVQTEPLTIQVPVQPAKAKVSKVQLNVNIDPDLITRLDEMLIRVYPPGKRKRNAAISEALEAWLEEKSNNIGS